MTQEQGTGAGVTECLTLIAVPLDVAADAPECQAVCARLSLAPTWALAPTFVASWMQACGRCGRMAPLALVLGLHVAASRAPLLQQPATSTQQAWGRLSWWSTAAWARVVGQQSCSMH
jgi:hypothetical protein